MENKKERTIGFLLGGTEEKECVNGRYIVRGGKTLMLQLSAEIMQELAGLELSGQNVQSYDKFFKRQSRNNANILKKLEKETEKIFEIINFEEDTVSLLVAPSHEKSAYELAKMVIDEELVEFLQEQELI